MLAVVYDDDLTTNDFCIFDKTEHQRRGKNFSYFTTTVDCAKVLFLKAGKTKIDLAAALAEVTAKYCVDKIILVGTTACADKKLPINSVVVSTSSFAYDVDFTPLGMIPFAMPNVTKYAYPADALLVSLAQTAALQSGATFQKGIFASADRFLADETKTARLYQEFGADFIDTSAATVGQFAYLNDIAYCAVKGVSDYADANAATDFNGAKSTASRAAFSVVLKMIALTCDDKNPCPCQTPMPPKQSRELIVKNNYATLTTTASGQLLTLPIFYRCVFVDQTPLLVLSVSNPDDNLPPFEGVMDFRIDLTGATETVSNGKIYKSAYVKGTAVPAPAATETETPPPQPTDEETQTMQDLLRQLMPPTPPNCQQKTLFATGTEYGGHLYFKPER